MSESRVKYRTVLEIIVIAAVIYVLVGTPGLQFSTSSNQSRSPQDDVSNARAKVENLVYPSKELNCARRNYEILVFSTSPLVLYIDGFLSEQEADHLIAER